MINTVGLFWKREDVFWGRGSQAGTLLGVPAWNITADPIDFRDQVGIYLLYADFDLVYIGQTGSGSQKLLERLRHHTRNQLADRWNRFSWFGVRWVKHNDELSALTKAAHPKLKDVLNSMEAIAIHAANPPLNKQLGSFGDDEYWYQQYRDDRLGPTESQMIREIWECLEDEDE